MDRRGQHGGTGKAIAPGGDQDDIEPLPHANAAVADLAAAATQSIIVYGADGTVHYWNPASTTLYGWPAGTAVGRTLDPLAPAGWLPPEAMTGDWRGSVTRHRMDGSPIEVSIRVVEHSRADGGIAELIEFGPIPPGSTGIEPPTRTVIAAPDSGLEDRFKRLIEHMPIALWQVDARSPGQAFEPLRAQDITDIAAYLDEHRDLVEFACDTVMVTNVNRAAVQLLGGRSEYELLKPVRYLFEATPEAAIRVMTAHFNGARNHIEELKVNTFDGRTLDMLLLVTYPQPPEDPTTTFISLIDITDRLAAEAQLRQLQADFAHASRISTLGELVASIAHEVKQPLTAIITNGGTGLRWLSRGDAQDQVAARIERIIDSAEQANEIIQRIQSMAAKREPVWTDLDLNEVIDEALQFVRYESVEKNVRIVADLAPALPLVCGDRVQLQQVLVNLLVNSLQAIDAGGGRDRLVRVRSASENGWIEITVSDSGPGIPPESLNRVFKGFFTTKEAGMGIGLTICQTIIASHGGGIEAANRAAGGAVIRFRLPESAAS
jgi:signal transduction histidine kinase